VLTVEDVLRLHSAGVSEDIIISEIIVTQTVFELSVEELLRLQSAGLSDRLIQFMVDTALPADRSATSDEGAAAEGGDSWINVIEEDPEPEVVYNVSLDYRYPYWWYDHYWYDYWYYDCHYAPYRSNWSFSIGVWYPGWYTWRGMYVWPACGYRNYCWGYGYSYPYYGYPYYACHGYPTYYYPGHPSGGPYALSTVKYKTNGAGNAIAARGIGLEMRDGRSAAHKPADLERSRSKARPTTELAHAGATLERKIGSRRPSAGHIVGEARPTRATSVRTVRAPATDVRPPKKVYTVRRASGVSGAELRAPSAKPSARVERPEEARVRSKAPATRETTVRPSPTRSRPAAAPSPRAPSGGSKSSRYAGAKGR
jgi:hypothetical protein